MATYLEWIARPNRINWYGLALHPRRAFLNWTLHSGSAYKTQWPAAGELFNVESLSQDGAAVTHAANVAEVVSTAGRWYHDRSTKPYYLYVRATDSANPYSHDIIGQFTARYCGGTPAGKIASDLGGFLWLPLMSPDSTPQVSQSLGDMFYGTAIPGSVDVSFANANGHFDKYLNDWLWKDSPAEFYHGDGGAEIAYADHRVVLLTCSNVTEISDEIFGLTFESSMAVLKKPALTKYFDIKDYPNMDASLQGKWIPELYGYFWPGLPAYPIDTNVGKFKVCGKALNSGVTGIVCIGDPNDNANRVAVTWDYPNAEFTVTSNVVTGVTATPKSGGTIAGGTYYIRVAALIEKVIG